LAPLDGEALFQRLLSHGIPCAPVYTLEQALNLNHTKSQRMVVDINNYKVTGIPVKLEQTPGEIRLPPPGIGEHTQPVLSSLGMDEQAIQALFETNTVK